MTPTTKTAPERPAFMDTPEFLAAVAASVQAAIPAIVAQVRTELQVQGEAAAIPSMVPSDGSAVQMMQQLALSISELTDQGTSRKKVAPEIIAERNMAYRRMIALLETVQREKDEPRYRLIAKSFLRDVFIEPFRKVGMEIVPQEIMWRGVPNDAMLPLNDVAKDIFEEYKSWVGTNNARINGVDARPFYMTEGGMVVKGQPPTRATANSTLPDSDDLRLLGPTDPRAKEVRILGTIADAAKQTAQGIA